MSEGFSDWLRSNRVVLRIVSVNILYFCMGDIPHEVCRRRRSVIR